MGRADWEGQFAEYFAVRAHALRRLGYGLSGDWHTAEDLVQATFVKLYRSWLGVRADSIDAYARRILINLYLSQRRSRRRELIVPEPPDRPAPAGTGVPERLALHAALAGLAPRQRAAVVLRYLEDLPVVEVAALLQISEGTVKSQTARGIQALRAALADPTSVGSE